jgi:hypothetical protein
VLDANILVRASETEASASVRKALSPEEAELRTAVDWARRIHERTASWLAANHARPLKA